MKEERNPYAPGAGTDPPELVGRSELLKQFEVALSRIKQGRPAKSLMPTGLRGVGKTVLLNRFVACAESMGYFTTTIEVSEQSDFVAVLAAHLRQVLFELDRLKGVNDKVRRALSVLRSFTLKVGLEGLSFQVGVEPLHGVADSGDLTLDVRDLCIALGEAAQARRAAVLIAIDEVQYLSQNEMAAMIMAIHRTTQLGLPIAVVATGLPQLPALAGSAKSYSERLFDFPDIGALNVDDVRAAISSPARRESVAFDDAALERLYEQTRGYPYFVQEFAYRVWNAALQSPIGLRDVMAIEPEVLRRLDESFFRVRYDRLTPREKSYLRAMAALGPGPHRSGDIATVLKARVESVGMLRNGLIRKGMIYSPQHGDTAFTVPLFDGFMLRMMPDWIATAPRKGYESE